jgi:hypothetical protein
MLPVVLQLHVVAGPQLATTATRPRRGIATRASYLNLAEVEPSPTDPLHLILFKDLRRAMAEDGPRP